jgi:hypothetical protein
LNNAYTVLKVKCATIGKLPLQKDLEGYQKQQDLSLKVGSVADL